MKSGLTYIIFVIDRSGSMEKIRNDMIGGFNAFIETQRKVPGECRVFGYKFDTKYEPMFENLDIKDVPTLDRNSFVPRGNTALYDSLGKTIVDMGKRLASTPEEYRPEKVLVVSITDGEDNNHLEGEYTRYDASSVKSMVAHQTQVYKWDFAYLGANQNAWAVGGSMGVAQAASLNYSPDSHGVAVAFAGLDDSVRSYRTSAKGTKFAFSGASRSNEPDDADAAVATTTTTTTTTKNKKKT